MFMKSQFFLIFFFYLFIFNEKSIDYLMPKDVKSICRWKPRFVVMTTLFGVVSNNKDGINDNWSWCQLSTFVITGVPDFWNPVSWSTGKNPTG